MSIKQEVVSLNYDQKDPDYISREKNHSNKDWKVINRSGKFVKSVSKSAFMNMLGEGRSKIVKNYSCSMWNMWRDWKTSFSLFQFYDFTILATVSRVQCYKA